MPEIVVKAQQSEPISNPQTPVPDDMVTTHLGLDIRDLSKKDIDQVNEISNYLKSMSDDEFQRADILRDIKYRLGTPGVTSNKLEQIYKYIKLRRAVAQTEEQIKEMEQ